MIRLALPLIAASLVSVIIAPLLSHVAPMTARRVSMMTLVSSAVAALVLLAHLSMRGIVSIPVLGHRLHSLLHLDGVHVVQSRVVGAVSLILAGVIIVKSAMMWIAKSKLRNMYPGGIITVSDPRLFAYAVPARRPGIIVSDSLVSSLSQQELNIVLRHERAHIEGRHDRWILAARLCSLANPFLVPMRRQLQLSLERIADDAAMRECGDARAVLTTLSKVALGKTESSFALGITSSVVQERIRWLKSGGKRSHPAVVTTVTLGSFSVFLLALLQGHHIANAIQSVCR